MSIYTNNRFGKLIAAFSIMACMMMPLAPAHANPNPPTGEVTNVITGPTLNARIAFRTFNIGEGGAPVGIATVIGKCNGDLFTFQLEGLFTYTTEVTLLGLQDYVAEGKGPAGCYSALGGEDVIIKKITKFVPAVNAADPAIADVDAQVIITKEEHTQPNN